MGSQRVGQDLAIQLAGMVEEEDKISLDVRKVSRLLIYDTWTSLVAQMVMNLPAMQETQARSLGQEDPLEKRKAIHSSILAWRISWREEPGGLQSMPLQRVGQDGSTNTYFLTQSNFSKIDDLTELLREIRAESTVDTP